MKYTPESKSITITLRSSRNLAWRSSNEFANIGDYFLSVNRAELLPKVEGRSYLKYVLDLMWFDAGLTRINIVNQGGTGTSRDLIRICNDIKDFATADCWLEISQFTINRDALQCLLELGEYIELSECWLTEGWWKVDGCRSALKTLRLLACKGKVCSRDRANELQQLAVEDITLWRGGEADRPMMVPAGRFLTSGSKAPRPFLDNKRLLEMLWHPKIKSINIAGDANVDWIRSFEQGLSLEDICIWANDTSRIALDWCCACPKLRDLSIEVAKDTVPDWNSLAKAKKLRRLCVSGDGLDDKGFLDILISTRLRYLDLENSGVKHVPWQTLLNSQSMRYICLPTEAVSEPQCEIKPNNTRLRGIRVGRVPERLREFLACYPTIKLDAWFD